MPFAKYSAPSAVLVALDASGPAQAGDLARLLAAEPDLGRRAGHLAALVALANAEAGAALAGLLAHGDPAVRACGVEGLRRLPAALSDAVLEGLLAAPSPDMRIRALDAIDRVPDPQVEGWLVGLLTRESDENVCGVVLDLLAEIGSDAALPAIRAARLRFANEPFVAFAADLALAQITGG